MDFAIFVASLDHHHPFHRRLPEVGDFQETVLVKVSYPLSPQTFCRSPIFRRHVTLKLSRRPPNWRNPEKIQPYVYSCTKAGAAGCIVVYHNCAASAASLRIQSSLSIESLRSGIGKRNDAMISLTQCMVLGGLGSDEMILGVAPCARHHSLLLSYLFNLKRGLAFVRDMIIADLRSSIDIGAMQQAADHLVVLRLFFSEYPEAA
jgi:hypothetical protein